jgi:hypothetical protein
MVQAVATLASLPLCGLTVRVTLLTVQHSTVGWEGRTQRAARGPWAHGHKLLLRPSFSDRLTRLAGRGVGGGSILWFLIGVCRCTLMPGHKSAYLYHTSCDSLSCCCCWSAAAAAGLLLLLLLLQVKHRSLSAPFNPTSASNSPPSLSASCSLSPC